MRDCSNASNRSECLLNDPEHPDHALYLQVSECLNGECHPKWGAGQRARVAAAMVVSARAAGLERVDQLVLSENFSTGELIQKPSADNNLFNLSTQIKLAEALRTPLAKSSDQWLQNITQQMREQVMLWEQQGIQPHPPPLSPRR